MLKALKTGERVELTGDANFLPHAIARVGERGTVSLVDGDYVEITLDVHHPGLDLYHNAIWLDEHTEPFPFKRLRSMGTPCARLVAACVVLGLLVGVCCTEAVEARTGHRGVACSFPNAVAP